MMDEDSSAQTERQAIRRKLVPVKYLTFVLGPPEGAPAGGPKYRPDIDEREVVGPVLHPGRRDESVYRPGNEFASEYTALKAQWETFGLLFNRAKSESDALVSKVMMKSAAVELRSFIDTLPRYVRLVSQLPQHDGSMPRAFMCLLDDERTEFRAATKAFNIAREAVFGQLTRLRNKVGAHMSQPLLVGAAAPSRGDSLGWEEIQGLWDALEPGLLTEIVETGGDLMDCIRRLPLHEFFRFESPTRMRLHVPLVGQLVGASIVLNGLSESLVKQIEGRDLGPAPVSRISLPIAMVLRGA
jgi:hypothetical protein